MSGPIPIFNITEQLSGLPNGQFNEPTASGLEGQEETNTNVHLDLGNLDISLGFLEIGYIYYYGIDQYEIKLILDRHFISSTSLQINIVGTESTMDLALDEFIRYKPVDTIYCKDICQINKERF